MSYITLYLANFWSQSQIAGTKFRRVRRFTVLIVPSGRGNSREVLFNVSESSSLFYPICIRLNNKVSNEKEKIQIHRKIVFAPVSEHCASFEEKNVGCS